MRKAGYILIALAMLAGCRKYDVPEFSSGTEYPNVAIGDLRRYCNGSSVVIADDVVISGRVVSSDRAGNFYNTFFMDDGTGAVEIMAGMPDLHTVYHRGQRVVVKVRGLAVGWGNGAMQIGLPPEAGSGFSTGYFYHPAVIRRYVSAEREIAGENPTETGIAGLSEEMCGRLVRINGLTADMESVTWATTLPQPATGYVKFRTSPADSLTVVTSGYATFAAMPVPHTAVSLTGILLYGKGGSSKNHFLLKLRDEKDIAY